MQTTHYARYAYFYLGGKIVSIDVGKLVKTFRKRAELTQESFADLMNVTQSTVSRIEKNVIACEVNFLVKAAKVTNCEDLAAMTLFGISTETLAQVVSLVPASVNYLPLFM